MRPSLLALLMAWSALCAVEPVAWDEVVARLRDGGAMGPFAVYLGSPDNRLPRLLRSGRIDTAGVPVAVVAAADQAINPLTGRRVAGARLQDVLGAGAGTVVFLDNDGVPVPLLAMPQAMHGDDPELFALYFGFVAGGHYRTMTLAEYCRALGREQVVLRAAQRVRNGFAGRELAADEKPLAARNHLTGENIEPLDEPGVFHLYSATADGRVFLRQIAEIAHAFGALAPRITLIVPDGAEPDAATLPDAVRCVLGHAPAAAIRAHGPSPMIVFSGNGRGMRLHGFQPADVLAKLIGLPLDHRIATDRDIPYAEVDEEQVTADAALAPDGIARDTAAATARGGAGDAATTQDIATMRAVRNRVTTSERGGVTTSERATASDADSRATALMPTSP